MLGGFGEQTLDKEKQNSKQNSCSKPEMTNFFYTLPGKGFLGVYNPDPQLFLDLIVLNEASSLHKNNPPSAAAAGEFSCKAPKFVFNREILKINCAL